MRSYSYKILIIIFSVLCGSFCNAQGYLKADGKTIVNGNGQEVLLRGMGLGGWMLQEGYMLQTSDFANTQHELKAKITNLVGQSGMEEFYNSWLENHVRKIDVDSLAAWGFNSIRLPMHYNLFTLPVELEPVPGTNTWLDKGFQLTDSLLSWCSDNHIYLILDLHAAPGGQGHDLPISDSDPQKPSLWSSKANRDKTVALWKRIAEHYKNEPWIGGYDLLNEPNWDLTNNTLLRQLYEEITDSIRTIDNNHIIFIEGNWWANDFTGLTPAWDNNMAYSFHKYWSYNSVTTIQWVLDIRNSFNVPIWMGEAGENSNSWFRDCITLLESNNIGWSWWPMKKIESISGLLSVKKTPGYQVLLDYWNGLAAKPASEYSQAALMGIAENLKLENCRYNKDVIHAIFHEINTGNPVPYSSNKVPGIIYAADYDLGFIQQTWSDRDYVNYSVSTGQYTVWNSGWEYRNDGVDIEKCFDSKNSNGYDVGWTVNGEWMNFTLEVDTAGIYIVDARVASAGTGGSFNLSKDGVPLASSFEVPVTGGWQTWMTVSSPGIYLDSGSQTVRCEIVSGNFNLSSFQFKLASVSALESGNPEPLFSIFPNPTDGRFSIKETSKFPGKASFSILDPLGRIIYPETEIENNSVDIDLSGHREGMYFIAIKTGKKTYHSKILYTN